MSLHVLKNREVVDFTVFFIFLQKKCYEEVSCYFSSIVFLLMLRSS